MIYRLSENFDLAEFVASATATMHHIINIPPPATCAFAQEFCDRILEPVRDRFGRVIITSGYRCPELNKLVHGVEDSDHQWTTERIAADFQTPDAELAEVFDWLRLESGLPFDQVIREQGSKQGGNCIHISYRLNPRRQALIGSTHNASGYQHVEVG
jgi:hypothetical protein